MEFTTQFELHSQTTRLVEGASHGLNCQPITGFSPSMTSCPKEHGPAFAPKSPLQITIRKRGGATDFKSELLPLHSQLLRQSLLVSFPPLIDMLKFSGYPYLIRGQTIECRGGLRRLGERASAKAFSYDRWKPLSGKSADRFRG